MDSAQFLERLRNRESLAYAELMEKYSRLLWAVVCQHLTQSSGFSAEDIEECVSDVFFELWENPHRYDPDKGSLKTFLCAVARNKAISIFRKNSKTNLVYMEDHQHPEPSYVEQEWEPTEVMDFSDLYASLSDLPEPTKEILVRRYFYDQKPAKIAGEMELPKKEVENRLYRGKLELQKKLTHPREVQG